MLRAERRAQLEQAQDEYAVVIAAGEQWAPSWKKTPQQWQEAVRIENRLRRALASYYRDLSQNASQFINWMKYAEAVGQVSADDAGGDQYVYESKLVAPDGSPLLVKIIFDEFNAAAEQGLSAAEELYQRYAVGSELSQVVERRSLAYVEQLAKNLDRTTYERVVQSINTSIRLGENTKQASERIMHIVDDPRRSDMIARTEMVRAYNSGIVEYGRTSGATLKQWETFAGACQICSGIETDPIAIGDLFNSGDEYPPAHPRCRCLVFLVYE